MYWVLCIAVVILVLLLPTLALEEKSLRREHYQKVFHAMLRAYDVPDPVTGKPGTVEHEIYRTHMVLGRRKRKCDICLDFYHDPEISREHCVLWYDGERFHLSPIYRPGTGGYTNLVVHNRLVPPEGVVLAFGQNFYINGHEFELVDTRTTREVLR